MLSALGVALILVAQADAPDDPQVNLETLQQLYSQSCGSRGYAAYDDVCNQITAQIRQAEREIARAAKPSKSVKRTSSDAPVSPQSAAPAAAAATETTPKAL